MTSIERTIEGGCHCGQVRYAVAADTFNATICHCSDCRRCAGSSSVAWFSAPVAGLRFTQGSPAQYRSSPNVVQTFCARCGTPLTYRKTDIPDQIDITIASADDPGRIVPADHVHVSEKIGWDVIGDGRPQISAGRSTT